MKKSLGILAIFAVGLFCLIFMYISFWGIRNNSYKIYVKMDNSSNLSLGTPVLMNGVKIGKVQDMYLESDNVIVVLSIDSKIKIPLGSEVRINYKGLIGDLLVNIFRTNSKEYYENNSIIEGQGAISTSLILEKMNKIADQLEKITKDISDSNIKNLIDNIENFSGNINETYSNLEKVFNEFKKDNYNSLKKTIYNIESSSESFKNFLNKTGSIDFESNISKVISNVRKTTDKVEKVLNIKAKFYPELKLKALSNLNGSLDFNGSLGIKISKLFFEKRNFKNWREGYTIKIINNFKPIELSLGMFENTPGLGIKYNVKNLSIAIDTYKLEKLDIYKLQDLGIDILGKIKLNDLFLTACYKLNERDFLLGLGYKF